MDSNYLSTILSCGSCETISNRDRSAAINTRDIFIRMANNHNQRPDIFRLPNNQLFAPHISIEYVL
jgi:transposase